MSPWTCARPASAPRIREWIRWVSRATTAVPARYSQSAMHRDRIKWNAKYHRRQSPSSPSRIVKNYAALSRKGRALDIAAGTGRNSVFLAGLGFSVDAVDISDVALRRLAGRSPNLHPVCADLDTFDIRPDRYDLICNIRFLSRRLFPLMIEGLAPGGILIFESYLEKQPGSDKGPTCRDYLLGENELLHAFLSLNILYYRETGGPVASLVAMKK
ncbi:MAG: tellurium resistance protein TehB [Deltaproteobacteria bacterium]|nr:MAG: tellurium resistance protein TehB [Deltaproteobacteria bacterium]